MSKLIVTAEMFIFGFICGAHGSCVIRELFSPDNERVSGWAGPREHLGHSDCPGKVGFVSFPVGRLSRILITVAVLTGGQVSECGVTS